MSGGRKRVEIHENQTCPLCREAVAGVPTDDLTACARCHAVYHDDCALELGQNRCANPACRPAPEGQAVDPGAPAQPCPRCHKPLGAGSYKKIPASCCTGCEGILVAQRDLRGFLDQLARDLLPSIHPDTPVPPLPDAGGGLRCPRCQAVMEHYGYMGSSLVLIDRCDACNVIWLDPEELGQLGLLFARTELRQQVFQGELERDRDPMVDEAVALREAHVLVNRYFMWL